MTTKVQLRRQFDVAWKVIAVLQTLPDVLAYYAEHQDGQCDFVYVEESVDAELQLHNQADYREGDHETTCGIVFGWLIQEHGVQPPAWYKRWMGW